jgi:hypothetical protein
MQRKRFSKAYREFLKHKELVFIPKGFEEQEFKKLKEETRNFLSEKFQISYRSSHYLQRKRFSKAYREYLKTQRIGLHTKGF